MLNARSDFTPKSVGVLLVLAVTWGFTFLLISLAVEAMAPVWLVAVRTCTGFAALALLLLWKRTPLPGSGRMWAHLAFLALPANVVPWTMVAWAQQTIPSGLTSVLYSLIPIMTLVISTLIALEPVSATKIVGLVVAAAGTIVIAGYDFGVPGHLGATIAVLVACFCLAGSAVYAKRFITAHVKPLTMATVQIGTAFLVSSAVALVVEGWPEWTAMGTLPVMAAVILGVFGTGMAFVLYYYLIGDVGPTNATLVTYLIPVVGLIAGWSLLDEALTIPLLVGALLIIAGVWIAQMSGPRVKRAA